MATPITPADIAMLNIRNLAATVLTNQQTMIERGVQVPERLVAFDEEVALLLERAAVVIEGEIDEKIRAYCAGVIRTGRGSGGSPESVTVAEGVVFLLDGRSA
jgi:hypothetical protein